MRLRHAALAFSPFSSRRSALPRTPEWQRWPLFPPSDVPAPSASSKLSLQALSSLYGGDFAGLSANFSPETGSLIPVPEYLVPDSLIEWGQVPSCLEVLTSEETKQDGAMVSLERQTITVLPEVGCGIDNLETTKVTESAQLSLKHSNSLGHWTVLAEDVVGLEHPLHQSRDVQRHMVETSFGLENSQRIRVLLVLAYSGEEHRIESPVSIILERKTSTSSSGGYIADHGGLDARTVARLIGEVITRKPFAEQKPLDAEELVGSWKNVKGASMHVDFSALSLPGDITFSWSRGSPSKLDVAHVSNGGSTMRLVRRHYDPQGNLSGDVEYLVGQRERQD